MKQKQVYVFYTEANKQEAQQVAKDINSADVNCILNGSTASKTANWAAESNALAVLLISDNFLKSLKDVRYLEQLLADDQKARVLAILTHGRREKEGFPNQMEAYPTEIHTLNNVMHYRDYWYEEWISLRKESKQVVPAKQAELNANKEIAKKMSVGSISTYIRKINKAPSVDWEKLFSNNYKELVAKLSNINAIDSVVSVEPKEEEVAVAITESVEAPPVDNTIVVEDTTEAKVEETKENNVEVSEKVKVEEEKVSNEDSIKEEEKEEKIEETVEEDDDEEFKLDISNAEDADVEGRMAEYKIEEVTDIDILFHIAESNTEDADYVEAKSAYERILQLDRYNGRALIWISRLLANHFENEGVLADNYYKKAIMVNDENAKLYYEYGLLQQMHFDSHYKASDSFREAIAIDPTLEEAYFGLAECLNKLGMVEPAKANYLQACVLDSSKFESKENDAAFGVIRHYEEEELDTKEALVEEVIEKPKSPNADTVVLVTGATSGIGKAIAEQFAINGYKVIATGRRTERLDEFKQNLLKAYDEIQLHCLPFDVTDLTAVKSALESLPEGWGNVDVLINNAGLAKGMSPVQEGNIDFWNTMIDTNIKGLLYMTRLVTPNMVERKKGHVINLGAAAGTQAYGRGGVYCATKVAVDSLTRTMRLDLHEHNVKVSCINPGDVETEFAKVRYSDSEKEDNSYDGFKPLSAKDVADAIYYVVSRPDHVNIQDMLLFGT